MKIITILCLIVLPFTIIHVYAQDNDLDNQQVIKKDKIEQTLKCNLPKLIKIARDMYNEKKYDEAFELFQVIDYLNESGVFYGTYPYYIHLSLEKQDFALAQELINNLTEQINNRNKYFNSIRTLKYTKEKYDSVQTRIKSLAITKEDLQRSIDALELAFENNISHDHK